MNDRLYNRIKGGIYHSTSILGYRGIRSSRAILPNSGGLPFSHGQSRNSCCHKLGAVSLLDLGGSASRPLVGHEAWSRWTLFLSNHKPITILLEIDRTCLTAPLYDYDSLKEHFPMATMVAEAEKCYAGPIPIHAVSRCVLVCAKLRTVFRIVPGNEVSDADLLRIETSFDRKLQKIGWTDHPCLWTGPMVPPPKSGAKPKQRP